MFDFFLSFYGFAKIIYSFSNNFFNLSVKLILNIFRNKIIIDFNNSFKKNNKK